MRGPWIVLGSAFTVVVLLSGAFQLVVFGLPWPGDHATEHATYTQPITKLVVDADSSDIRIRVGGDGNVAVTRKLRWHSDRPQSSETWAAGVLTVRPQGCSGRGTCDIDYTIDVPAGTSVEVTTSSGDVDTSDLTGAQSLVTTSGDIDVRNSAGDLVLEASSGDIGVRAAEPASVTARASSGDISIALPRTTYDVQADASSGDVNVDVQRDSTSPNEIVANASSGDIQVRYR